MHQLPDVHAYVSMHGYDEDIITKVQIGGNRNGDYDYSNTMLIDNVRFYLTAISSKDSNGIISEQTIRIEL